MPERIAPELVERIPLDQLAHLRGNPRRGDHDVIRESLEAHGQVEAIVVNRGSHTGVRNEIVAGNNRVQVMRDLGWTEAAVSWVDAPSRVELNKLAVILNHAGDRATTDERKLADLMAAIAAESSLTGTGFNQAEYDDLMRVTDVYGDAAAGFLASVGTEPDPTEEDLAPRPAPAARPAPQRPQATPPAAAPTEDPGPAYVPVTWTVTPPERDIVREALRVAQSKHQTGTAAAALVTICDLYLRENR